MATVSLCPILNAVPSFVLGVLNAGGLVNTYLAGTSTPAATYSDSGGTSLNANPITIGPNGYLPAELWLLVGTAYKIVITDSASGNAATFDNITAAFAAGALAGITDLTTSGNTILGGTAGKTLNVANGALAVDASSNVTIGTGQLTLALGRITLSSVDGNGLTQQFSSTASFGAFTLKNPAGNRVLEFIGWGSTSAGGYGAGPNDRVINASSAGGDFYISTSDAARMKFAGSSNDITAQGVSLVRSKLAATSRNSTTTLADDPDLIVPLTAGRWSVYCYIPLFSPVSGAGGFKSQLAFSGTLSTSFVSYRGSVLGAAVSDSARLIGAVVESSATITSGNASNPDYVVYEGGVTVSVAGNLSFQWAQQSSNVAFASVGNNAVLQCMKVG